MQHWFTYPTNIDPVAIHLGPLQHPLVRHRLSGGVRLRLPLDEPPGRAAASRPDAGPNSGLSLLRADRRARRRPDVLRHQRHHQQARCVVLFFAIRSTSSRSGTAAWPSTAAWSACWSRSGSSFASIRGLKYTVRRRRGRDDAADRHHPGAHRQLHQRRAVGQRLQSRPAVVHDLSDRAARQRRAVVSPSRRRSTKRFSTS